MADHALNTELSRRTILSRCASALVPVSVALPAAALAAPPKAAPEVDGVAALPGLPATSDEDGDLLRLLADLERLYEDGHRATADYGRLLDLTYEKSGFTRPPSLCADRTGFDLWAERTGCNEAGDRMVALAGAFPPAADRAYGVPVRSLTGIAVKLRFAMVVARRGADGLRDDEEWLWKAIEEVERLAGIAVFGDDG
mgnify:CR=1 FL=1